MTLKTDHKKRNRFAVLVYLVAALWIVEGINFFTGHKLCSWGILPRTLSGLVGIPLSPFLHSSIMHLVINTGPMVILGGLIILGNKKLFLELTFLIVILGGVMLWIIGRPSYHVGASGLVFGYFGYLVSKGIFKISILNLAVSMGTLFVYGGLLWGLLPVFSHISWEGHLCGLVAGIGTAFIERYAGKKAAFYSK